VGKKDDPMAVLDSQARVWGLPNLRVVDASSFPLLVPGHPQSTVCKLYGSPLLENIRELTDNAWADALAEKIACDISGNC
jgi:hypothetical protein